MANTKISQLNPVTTLTANDTFPVVQGSETKKAKISDVKNYLPISNSVATGLLTNTDWNTFNNKQNTLTLGNLTESTSSVLTISGNVGSVIGSGLTIQVKQASSSQGGYLSSSDWTTFNNKMSSLSLTTTGTSGAATLVGSTLNIPQYLGAAVTSLGSQTGATQTFSTDTTGTDFTITSAANNHKFSIPNASASARGLLTAADYSTFNGKQNALTLGNLTESTSSVLTITGGTGSVVGSGTTIQVKQANGSQGGFLSSGDWTTFNGKQGALTLTTTGSSGAATLVNNVLNIPQYTGGGSSYTFSTGLTNSSGTVTSNLSTGVLGGQSVIGGTASGNSLTLSSTSNATKGNILFGTSSYDEVNNRLGIGTTSPNSSLHVVGSQTASTNIARGSYFKPTLTAVSNSDNLVSLDIEPTFTLGAFTSAKRLYMRMVGGLQVGLNTGGTSLEIQSLISNVDFLGISGNTGTFNFYGGGAYNAGAGIVLTGSSNSSIGANIIRFYNGAFTARGQISAAGNWNLGTSTTDAGFRLDVGGTTRLQGNITISDTYNLSLGSTTGTRIGTSNTEKLGFWNVTPIVQPTTTVTSATRVGGAGTTITTTDTFDGYTLAQVVKALRNSGLLA